MEGWPQNQNYRSQAHVWSKVTGLRVEKNEPISKENFKEVRKDQDLQQVIELKIEDTTCQKLDEEVKEKKVELIMDNCGHNGESPSSFYNGLRTIYI